MSTDRELLIQEISHAQFTPVRLREGYDMGEVDEFLDRVVSAAAHADRVPPMYADAPQTQVATAHADTVPETPTPSVIQEQRGLLSRLKR